jgi:large subunit ribosomal protein L43
MATRGVFQLQKLTVFYCEVGGSSIAIREFLASGKLHEWARDRPHLPIEVRVRNGHHPYAKGDYLNSPSETLHQICIKSNKALIPDIPGVLNKLYNRSGRKIKKLTVPIVTQTPSVQGIWTPNLNLHLTPPFAMHIE